MRRTLARALGLRRARGAGGGATASEQLLTLATEDGWLMVANSDDASTVTLRESGGNEFQSELADGLANVGAFAQTTAADQPQHVELTNNGKTFNAGRYDGANTYLTRNTDLQKPLPISILAVFSVNTGTTVFQEILVEDLTNTRYAGWSVGITDVGTLQISFYSGGSASGSERRTKAGTTDVRGSMVVASFVFRGATDMDIRIDGTDDGGTYSGSGGALVYDGNGGAQGSAIDGSRFLDGDLPLAMFYNGDAVGDGVMSSMEDKCKEIYGVA